LVKKLAYLILRYRLWILISMSVLSLTMSWLGTRLEISYFMARLLPDTDPAVQDYNLFKNKFGQDGTVLIIATELSAMNNPDILKKWKTLGDTIRLLPGIKNVVFLCNLKKPVFNDTASVFELKDIMPYLPENKEELDEFLNEIYRQKFYDGIFFSREKNFTTMAVTFYEKSLNSAKRIEITEKIKHLLAEFEKETGLVTHASGLPFIRSVLMKKIQSETTFFMILAAIVSSFLLFVFFRHIIPVLFSILVVGCGMGTALGFTYLMGYKLTILSGLIPPLIIVIGIPNCIMILTRYHTEISKGIEKMQALFLALQRSMVSLFYANFTTAIGFGVFCMIKNELFFEFGLIASVNVMMTYIYSISMVPAIFSYLPKPGKKHIHHLDTRSLRNVLNKVSNLTIHHRKWIYASVILLVLISAYGISKVRVYGFMVDDLPDDDEVIKDLKYFEEKMGGVLPFEIFLDTRKENGVFSDNARALYRINKLQRKLSGRPNLSRSLSIADGVKFLYQAYRGGEENFYRLPSITDLKKLAESVKNEKDKKNQLQVFLDTTRRYTHISFQIANIESGEMKKLVKEVYSIADSVFNMNDENQRVPDSLRYDIRVTGNPVVFLKGNDFLVSNLLESVLTATVLIILVMIFLFSSPLMILISIVPSLTALSITAGIMGYADIPLKPSTILVFSIAFGIASDGTLYFLTKYRHELKMKKSISDAVRITISETGVSMVYTALILFFGFGMFMLSGFGGTRALGILISLTLLVAYCTNLVLLPAFLLSLEKRIAGRSFIKSGNDANENEE